MLQIKVHDIVLQYGYGNGLRVEGISGQFAVCIPSNKLKDPFRDFFKKHILLNELVEVMEEVRRRKAIRDTNTRQLIPLLGS